MPPRWRWQGALCTAGGPVHRCLCRWGGAPPTRLPGGSALQPAAVWVHVRWSWGTAGASEAPHQGLLRGGSRAGKLRRNRGHGAVGHKSWQALPLSALQTVPWTGLVHTQHSHAALCSGAHCTLAGQGWAVTRTCSRHPSRRYCCGTHTGRLGHPARPRRTPWCLTAPGAVAVHHASLRIAGRPRAARQLTLPAPLQHHTYTHTHTPSYTAAFCIHSHVNNCTHTHTLTLTAHTQLQPHTSARRSLSASPRP